MNAYVKGGLIAVALMVAIFTWYQSYKPKLPANQSPAEFGLIAEMEQKGVPDFTLKRQDGTELKLSDLKGKIIVLNFWASWCNPCVEEFPSMQKLVKEFKDDVVIVAVSTDDNLDDINAFTKAFGLPQPGFEVVWDENKTVMEQYGIDKIPETFLVGRDFKLIRKVLGIEDWATPQAFAYFRSLTKAAAPAEESTPNP